MKKNLKGLFVEELRTILDAETELTRTLTQFASATESADLRKSLRKHLKESKSQISRLRQVFTRLGLKMTRRRCLPVRALLQECKQVLRHYPASAFRDAALITKLQHIKHYEMSAYGTLCAFAKELDLHEKVPALLHKTFEEELREDQILTKLAKGNVFRPGINRVANEWSGHRRQVSGW